MGVRRVRNDVRGGWFRGVRIAGISLLGVALVCGAGEAPPGRTWVVDQRHPQAGDAQAGTPEAPLKTIGRAAAAVQPGDRVLIRAGVYRETVTVRASGTAERPIRFEAEPGAPVVITGADVLTDWTREPGPEAVFSTPWPHVFLGWSPENTHPGGEANRVIGRAEQVFVQGYLLHQVLRREELSRGTFFVDRAAGRLLVRTLQDADPGSLRVEASVRPVLWDGKGEHIHLRGIRFRYAANAAQSGAAVFRGAAVVEDCVFERTNSIGASFLGPGIVVRRCVFQDNGQMGFSAGRAHGLLLTECLVRHNNTKDYPRGWEAGGNKLCLCRGVVIEKSQFIGNRGNGI